MSLKKFVVTRAFGQSRVGDIVNPTGILRGELIRLGYIRPVDAPIGKIVEEKKEQRREQRRKKLGVCRGDSE